MKIGFVSGFFGCLVLAAFIVHPAPVCAEQLSGEQLRSVMLDQSDLQGFYRRQLQTLNPSQTKNGEDSDYVLLNHDVTQFAPGRGATSSRTGTINYIRRIFVSTNRSYELDIDVTLCDSAEDARDEVANFRKGTQAAYSPGSLTGGPQIGDASWYTGTNTLLFVCGKAMFFVSGDTATPTARQEAVPPFPASAIEAAAYQALLCASNQPEITGVSAEQTSIAVNRHALPKGALKVAGHVYVPVGAFAQAMGLMSQFDPKTGALTLSGTGRKTVALTAGSTAATVGGAKVAALSVPVLKQAGQPVMTLDDLLTLTGGKITGRSEGKVQVKS